LQLIIIEINTLHPALPNIVAICNKCYEECNVIIAIFNHSYTTDPLFATNESNVLEQGWATLLALRAILETS